MHGVFWRYLDPPFCSDLKSNFTVEFSDFFLRRRRWIKWISGHTKIYSGLGFPHLGLLISGGLRLPNGTPPECTPVPRVSMKTFSLGCTQDSANSAVFLLRLRPRWKIPECFTAAESASLTFIIGLPPTARRSVVYNWSLVHFGYYKKRPYRLAWSRPCNDRGQIEPTSVFRSTTDPCQISSRSVNIWKNGTRKYRIP